MGAGATAETCPPDGAMHLLPGGTRAGGLSVPAPPPRPRLAAALLLPSSPQLLQTEGLGSTAHSRFSAALSGTQRRITIPRSRQFTAATSVPGAGRAPLPPSISRGFEVRAPSPRGDLSAGAPGFHLHLQDALTLPRLPGRLHLSPKARVQPSSRSRSFRLIHQLSPEGQRVPGTSQAWYQGGNGVPASDHWRR